MPTETQRTTSRDNGSKGKGSTTAAGKERSKMNALKHGLTGEFTVLPGESHSAFENLRDAYIERVQPRDASEYSIALLLAQSDWELHRAARDQHIATVIRMEDQREAFNREFDNAHPSVRITRARQVELRDGESVRILDHHITRIENRMNRQLRRLILLRNCLPLPSEDPAVGPAGTNEIQNSPNEPGTHLTPQESTTPAPASRTAPAAAARYSGPAPYACDPEPAPETQELPAPEPPAEIAANSQNEPAEGVTPVESMAQEPVKPATAKTLAAGRSFSCHPAADNPPPGHRPQHPSERWKPWV